MFRSLSSKLSGSTRFSPAGIKKQDSSLVKCVFGDAEQNGSIRFSQLALF